MDNTTSNTNHPTVKHEYYPLSTGPPETTHVMGSTVNTSIAGGSHIHGGVGTGPVYKEVVVPHTHTHGYQPVSGDLSGSGQQNVGHHTHHHNANAPTGTVHHQHHVGGHMPVVSNTAPRTGSNMSYCFSIPGLLKILEILLGMIVIILAAYETSIRFRPGSVHYFLFTASFCLIFTILFLLFWACYKSTGSKWNLMEMLFNLLAFVLYLIASIVLVVISFRRTFWIVAAILGFVLTIFYLLSAIFNFIEWRRG